MSSEQDVSEKTIIKKKARNEESYKKLCQKILRKGEIVQNDRTGVGTVFLSGQLMKFDLRDNHVPIITMKKTFYDKIIIELLFFISGKTDTKILEKFNVKFWMANTSREFLDKRGLTDYPVGCYGPTYGFQWRHCGAHFTPEKDNYDEESEGVDQLQQLIDGINNDPHGRRHILTSWIPQDLDKIPLPPCHIMLLCSVSGCGQYIDGTLIQRSGDMFLGVPFNIASYSILLHMIAYLTNKKARYFKHYIENAHIYLNHIDQTKLMISRECLGMSKIEFANTDLIKTIDDFRLEDIIISDYKCHPFIKADMAV